MKGAPIPRGEPNLPIPRQMDDVPLRVWSGGCDDLALPGIYISEDSDASVFSAIENSDNVVLPMQSNALTPSQAPETSLSVWDGAGVHCEGGRSKIHGLVIETADVDGPMELRSDDEFEGGNEENDARNGSDSDGERLDLFEGVDLSSYGGNLSWVANCVR